MHRCDSVGWVGGQSSGMYDWAHLVYIPLEGNNWRGEPDYRHGKVCNVLFHDFHVDGKIYGSIPADKNNLFWKK